MTPNTYNVGERFGSLDNDVIILGVILNKGATDKILLSYSFVLETIRDYRQRQFTGK